MKITWWGSGTLSVESGDEKILFDPFIQLPGGEHPTDMGVFQGIKNAFVTRGQGVPLSSVPQLIKSTKMLVHCGPGAAKTLIKMGISMKQIRSIHLGDIIPLGNVQVSALKGKHVGFGPFMLLKTMLNPRIIRYSQNLPKLAKIHSKFSSADVTIVYKIKCEEKTLLILGSMALDERTEYPKEVDVLILPYQGSSSLQKKAMAIIRKLRPKLVIVHHFDDGVPPLTKSINPKKFRLGMKRRMPQIPVLIPQVGVPIEIVDDKEKKDEI